jgi:hypothetical protein
MHAVAKWPNFNSLRNLSVLGVSAVMIFTRHFHCRDAEHAEVAQRGTQIWTLPAGGTNQPRIYADLQKDSS